MEEILHRAKRTYNNEWLEGYYCKYKEKYVLTSELEIDDCILTWIPDDGMMMYKIFPETICPFTGMYDSTKWEDLTEKKKKSFLSKWNHYKDRNNIPEDWIGKRIWKNDIVRHKESYTIGIVKWCQDDYVGWCVDDFVNGEQQFSKEMWKECEVIGNIFDNPELLEPESQLNAMYYDKMKD